MSENANVGKVFNVTGGGGGSGSLKLVSISVKTPPTKTTYKSGETFDPTGMVIEADYGFGLTSEVTGFSCAPTVLTDGTTAVTITYTENRVTKTTTQAVTVEKVLTGIAVTTNPTKMAYNYLEQFAPAGMVVTASFTDGSTQAVNGYTYPTSAFNTLGTNAVELSYTYEGVTETTSLNVTVNAIQLPLPAQSGTIEYDGTAKQPTWNANYDSSKMSFTGDTEGINAADDYTVTFETIYGYVFPNGTRQADVTWAIDRQSIAAVPTQSNVLVADGTQKVPEWNGFVNGQLTKGSDLYGTAAGNYTMTFTPTANYKWWDGSTGAKDATWTITSVLVTIPSQKNVPTYSPGVSRTPEWDNFDETNSEVTVTAQTDAGDSYTATFHLLRGMWTDGTTADKTINWAIERATLSAVPTQANAASLKYDGNPKTPSWDSNYDSSKMTLDVTAQTLAGTNYSASFTPTANYKWFDGSTTAKTATWAIAKGDNSASASPSSITLNTSNLSKTFTVTRNGNGTITAESSNTGVATVGSINQNTGIITINSVNNTTGSATITVHVAAGDNYAACADITVPVTAQFVTIYGVEWDWTNGTSTKGTRTDAAAGFSDPSPAVNNGNGSSPFDNLYPWSQMTKETRTGGVMVKEPKYYFKWTITENGKKVKLQIADGPVTGFFCDPVNMDRGDGLGELDYSYIARYHCGTSDWKSTTGVAQKVSITRSAARTGIHGLGSYIWQMDLAQMWYVGMLYLVEYADWDGQATIGYGCSASGSKENNGKTDAMAYHTGTTAASRTTYGYTQYRNIEGWWDNVYDWMDGCYYNSNGLNVILNPANFSDTANGTLIGSMPSGGYPNALQVSATSGFEWCVRPLTTGGSNTTCVPDYWNFNGSYPCLLHGGDYYQYQYHGPFCVYCYSASYTCGYIGCRLQERPPKAA